MAYTRTVQGCDFDGFEWDAKKSECCYQRSGFNFNYAAEVFDAGYIEWQDLRRDYGEPRFVAIGEVEGRVLAVVRTPRGTVRRIISARAASRRERRQFYGTREAKQQADP